MTDDEIDAAIRTAVPEACFAPNAAARAIYLAGYRAGIEAALADERAWRGSSAPEDIARRFHDAYEHFAPQFGYSTRPESRKAWDELPQNLRDLMVAVVRSVLIEQPAADRIAELEADLERMTAARNRDHQQALANGAALAAERERREAAENLLLSYESQDFRAIAKHFARYEKLCASSSRALAD